ncbi:NAD-P-binding protein [Rickenella mellea]|uniref:NAD-P-binding protein n=1 Tax=Rickenella mellea TaxID=50990 RepID=A0A4Y7PY85_9AGAM|nr:NAD-P-binding protein [Rickenella mellea]
MSQKLTVIIFGATGKTGASIVNGLIDSNKFNIFAAVRPASKDKPEVEELKSRGVEIRLVDLQTVDDSTVDVLRGIDVVISATSFETISPQKRLVDAAKKAGIKRFIPNDWATACVRGKGLIQDYIREIGIGYTFIDVGLWFRDLFPPVERSQQIYPGQIADFAKIYGGGEVKIAVTDLRDIGPFVARIIDDPRTLNHYEIDIAEKARGVKIETTIVSPADAEKASARAAGGLLQLLLEYIYSWWVRGDNVIENAKKPEYGGALDARELYPDIKPRKVADFARSFYAGSN